MHPIPCFRAPWPRGLGYRVETILRSFPPSKYIPMPNFTQIGQTVWISVMYEYIYIYIYIYIYCALYIRLCKHINKDIKESISNKKRKHVLGLNKNHKSVIWILNSQASLVCIHLPKVKHKGKSILGADYKSLVWYLGINKAAHHFLSPNPLSLSSLIMAWTKIVEIH